ncbi:MAG: hypothetical protein M5U26_08340 [Planctomycetota bacterium]|nr:hypothetical protein [Planctomycetota bacterium]
MRKARRFEQQAKTQRGFPAWMVLVPTVVALGLAVLILRPAESPARAQEGSAPASPAASKLTPRERADYCVGILQSGITPGATSDMRHIAATFLRHSIWGSVGKDAKRFDDLQYQACSSWPKYEEYVAQLLAAYPEQTAEALERNTLSILWSWEYDGNFQGTLAEREKLATWRKTLCERAGVELDRHNRIK